MPLHLPHGEHLVTSYMQPAVVGALLLKNEVFAYSDGQRSV